MSIRKILVFHPKGGKNKTIQTEGIQREELTSSVNSWVGFAHTAPRFVSGWHHHSDFDSYIYVISGKFKLEFGKNGEKSCEGAPGDAVHVPKHTIHRESNPSDRKQALFVVRIGKGVPVVNVEGSEK